MVLNHDKTQVLLITNGHFPKWSNDKDIPNVAANAERLERAFIDIVGIPKTNIHKLADYDSRSILTEFQNVGNECTGKDSTLIIYYAGHGIPVSSKGLFWATADTEVNKERSLIYSSAIRTSDIRNMLEDDCNAERKILISDCCYAADFLEGKQGGLSGFIQKNITEIKGTFFMFSSNSDNESTFPIDRKDSPTFFTDALVLSLQEGIEPDQEYCTIGRLFNKVVENVGRLKIKYNKAIPEPDKRIDGNAEEYKLYRNPKYQDLAETELKTILVNPNRDKILKWIDDNPFHEKVCDAIDALSMFESAEGELSVMASLPADQRAVAYLNYAKKYSTIIYLRSMALDKYAKEKAVSAKPEQLEGTGTGGSMRNETDKMISSTPRSA